MKDRNIIREFLWLLFYEVVDKDLDSSHRSHNPASQPWSSPLFMRGRERLQIIWEFLWLLFCEVVDKGLDSIEQNDAN